MSDTLKFEHHKDFSVVLKFNLSIVEKTEAKANITELSKDTHFGFCYFWSCQKQV